MKNIQESKYISTYVEKRHIQYLWSYMIDHSSMPNTNLANTVSSHLHYYYSRIPDKQSFIEITASLCKKMYSVYYNESKLNVKVSHYELSEGRQQTVGYQQDS